MIVVTIIVATYLLLYLATSGSCPRHSRMAWALMRSAQQGKQNNMRMMMPRWRITPTCSRFLPPNVCQYNAHFEQRIRTKHLVSITKLLFNTWLCKTVFLTWDTRVSHANPRPNPVAAEVTLMVWNGNVRRSIIKYNCDWTVLYLKNKSFSLQTLLGNIIFVCRCVKLASMSVRETALTAEANP